MEFSEVIKQRYSVRKFKDIQIEDDKLEKILTAGLLAPTAKNNQPIKLYVIKSEEVLSLVKETTPCHFDAPVILVGAYDKEQCWVNKVQQKLSGEQDISIVMTQIMLEAFNQGIGSCWVNMFDAEKLAKNLKLSDNIVPVCLMPIGYPSDDSEPGPLHFVNKKLSEIVEMK